MKYKWPQPPGVAPILALQSIAISPVVRFQLDHYFTCFVYNIIMQRLHLRWPTVVQPDHFTCGGYGCALIGFACHIFSVVCCGMLGCDMYGSTHVAFGSSNTNQHSFLPQIVHFNYLPLVVSVIATSQANTGVI